MKNVLVAALGLLAIGATSATAADLPVKARPVVPVVTVYNWTGIYSASSIGFQWWKIKGDYINTGLPDEHNTSGSRFSYGSHLGAQYQFQNVVVGIEASYNSSFNSALTSSNSISVDCNGSSAVADRTCGSRIKNFWTFGGKLGWAWDNWMVYGAGGYANGRIDTQTTVTSTGVLTSQTTNRHGGWYAGAGFDVFVTKLWWTDLIIGVEYRHVQFRSRTHIDELPGANGVNDRNIRASDDIVRLKLTSKLNWAPAAVVAKY